MDDEDLFDFVVKLGQFVSAAVTFYLLMRPDTDATIPSYFLLFVNVVVVCVIVVMQVRPREA